MSVRSLVRSITVAGALFLALTAGASAAGRAGSGLFGSVTMSPVTPVCVAGRSCSAPVPNLPLAFARSGVDVARVTTAADGTYRIRLAPGTYTVRRLKRIGMSMTPVTVQVPGGRWKHQSFSIDTGIR